jgi:hypothetical protein
MLSVTFKHATQLHFGLLLGQAQTQAGGAEGNQQQQHQVGLLAQLETALQSRTYEVRCAALKMLLRHVLKQQEKEGQQQLAAALRPLLLRQLGVEGHHKAQRRLLHLLALLPPAEAAAAGSDGGGGAAAGFAAMLQRASAATDSRIRQHTVQCLGPVLLQLLRQQGGIACGGSATSGVAAAAEQLLGLISECSQPWQLPELRLAAASAVAASGLLLLDPLQSDGAAAAAAGAWAALLLLVEDEDDEVREAARSAAAASLASFASSGSGVASPAAAAVAAAAAVTEEAAAPSEERVLRLLLPALAARFRGPHPALLALLCRLCCPSAARAGAEAAAEAAAAEGSAAERTAAAAAAAKAAAAAAAAAGRIFDREPDNIHEELLLQAQVGCWSRCCSLPRLWQCFLPSCFRRWTPCLASTSFWLTTLHAWPLFLALQLAAETLAQLLPQVAQASPAEAQVHAWADTALSQLQQLAATLKPGAAQQPQQPGAGGSMVLPLYHHHFADLYCCWLSLWAAARMPSIGSSSSWGEATAAAVAELAAGLAGPAAAGTTPQLAAVAEAAAAAWQQWQSGSAGDGDSCGDLLFLV